VMDVTIDGLLDGLGQSSRRIRGFASGSVLVRNPKFSLAFTHPRTIAPVTLHRVGDAAQHQHDARQLVSVTLPEASLSGAIFEPGTRKSPSSARSCRARRRPPSSGCAPSAPARSPSRSSPATATSSGVPLANGRRRARRRALARLDRLSRVRRRPARTRAGAVRRDRALPRPGALVATAAQLPAGVLNVSRGALNQRVVEIAEAGQRLRYGDGPAHVLSDLLLDFQGARSGNPGLDQIWRETDAGRELREAFLAAIAASANDPDAVALLAARAADLAGRGEAWHLAAVGDDAWSPSFEALGVFAELDDSAIPGAAGFSGAASDAVDGHWLASAVGAERAAAGRERRHARHRRRAARAAGRRQRRAAALVGAAAAGRRVPARRSRRAAPLLDVDESCDGSVETSLVPAVDSIAEAAPTVLAVVQDESVLAAGRSSTARAATSRTTGPSSRCCSRSR